MLPSRPQVDTPVAKVLVGVAVAYIGHTHTRTLPTTTTCTTPHMPSSCPQVDTPVAKVLVGVAVAYIGLIVLVPFANVFYQVRVCPWFHACTCAHGAHAVCPWFHACTCACVRVCVCVCVCVCVRSDF